MLLFGLAEGTLGPWPIWGRGPYDHLVLSFLFPIRARKLSATLLHSGVIFVERACVCAFTMKGKIQYSWGCSLMVPRACGERAAKVIDSLAIHGSENQYSSARRTPGVLCSDLT